MKAAAGPLIICTLLLVPAAGHSARSTDTDLLKRSQAAYTALASYADTGTVVQERPGIVDRSKFRTCYRRQSLDFLFDYQGVTSKSAGYSMDASAKRIVLWMVKGDLQSYNQTLQRHDTFPREGGKQTAALQNAAAATAGTSILIPSMIFAKSDLPGTLRQIQEATDAGMESVDGRRCHKLIGVAAEYYPSGARVNVRQVTVWIDAETLLVRKLFEDTPKGYAVGSYSKVTVTIDPQPNPRLDDAAFHFAVPSMP